MCQLPLTEHTAGWIGAQPTLAQCHWCNWWHPSCPKLYLNTGFSAGPAGVSTLQPLKFTPHRMWQINTKEQTQGESLFQMNALCAAQWNTGMGDLKPDTMWSWDSMLLMCTLAWWHTGLFIIWGDDIRHCCRVSTITLSLITLVCNVTKPQQRESTAC